MATHARGGGEALQETATRGQLLCAAGYSGRGPRAVTAGARQVVRAARRASAARTLSCRRRALCSERLPGRRKSACHFLNCLQLVPLTRPGQAARARRRRGAARPRLLRAVSARTGVGAGRLRRGCLLRLSLSPDSPPRRRHRAREPGGSARPEVPASFADNSFVRGSLHPPAPGCGRAAAGSAVTGAARAAALGARGRPFMGWGARGWPRLGWQSGGARAGVASAHGEKGRPAQARWRASFWLVLGLQTRGSRVPSVGFLRGGEAGVAPRASSSVPCPHPPAGRGQCSWCRPGRWGSGGRADALGCRAPFVAAPGSVHTSCT